MDFNIFEDDCYFKPGIFVPSFDPRERLHQTPPKQAAPPAQNLGLSGRVACSCLPNAEPESPQVIQTGASKLAH